MQNPVDLKTLQRGEYWIHAAMQNCKHQQNGMQKSETYQCQVTQDVQVPPTDEGQRTNNMHQAIQLTESGERRVTMVGGQDSRGRDHMYMIIYTYI